MRFALLTTLFAGILLLPGCYYDNEEELYPNTFCDTANVTWDLTIEPLVQTECALPGCHVTGAQSPDLTTYAGVKAIADDGRMRGVLLNGTPFFMPASGPLPSCSQEKVSRWLDAGAPNN